MLTLCATVSSTALGLPDPILSRDRLDVWGTKDGLPPQNINCLAQTPDGLVWLGTAAGLLCFDGQTFTLYDKNNTPSLKNNLITALGTGPDGTLWVGIEWQGFGTFRDGVYHGVSKPDRRWNYTNAYYFDDDGSFWVVVFGSVLFFFFVGGSLFL